MSDFPVKRYLNLIARSDMEEHFDRRAYLAGDCARLASGEQVPDRGRDTQVPARPGKLFLAKRRGQKLVLSNDQTGNCILGDGRDTAHLRLRDGSLSPDLPEPSGIAPSVARRVRAWVHAPLPAMYHGWPELSARSDGLPGLPKPEDHSCLWRESEGFGDGAEAQGAFHGNCAHPDRRGCASSGLACQRQNAVCA